MGSARFYDPDRDYRSYVVTDSDLPLLSTRAAALKLGHRQTESVRQLIVSGRLPSRRTRSAYNARYEIPTWAIDGLASFRRGADRGPVGEERVLGGQGDRIAALENALVALRAAAERETNARRLLEQALQEAGAAVDILKDAVGSVLVPQGPPH